MKLLGGLVDCRLVWVTCALLDVFERKWGVAVLPEPWCSDVDVQSAQPSCMSKCETKTADPQSYIEAGTLPNATA